MPLNDPPPLPEGADRRLHRFLDHWTALAGTRPFPPKSALDPVDMPELLPYVFLVDVIEGPPLDFAYRLLGSDVVANTARSHIGQRLSDIADEGRQGQLIELYRAAVEARAPRFGSLGFRTRLGNNGRYDVLVAPLGTDRITHLAGIAIHYLGKRETPPRIALGGVSIGAEDRGTPRSTMYGRT